jgi:Flp pilus assembly protein TadG
MMRKAAPLTPDAKDCGPAFFWRDRRGATALEFALLAPLLFTLILGGIEFSRLIWTESALNYSVQEGARCGLVNPDGVCGTSSAVATFAAAATPQLAFPTSTFTVNVAAACGYQVTASYDYQFLVSGLLPYRPTLTAQACFPA